MARLRRRDVLTLTVGSAILMGTAALSRRGVTEGEIRLFRTANQLPDAAFPAAWVPMQYGSFGAVPVLAAAALIRRRSRLALALGTAGAGAWVLAKAVKPLVGRGRPEGLLSNVNLHGKEEGDLGFPSGHAAVSAALTTTSWAYLSSRERVLAVALAGFVPIARLYVGAHLPLDALGGSALGLAIGSAVNLAGDHLGRSGTGDQGGSGKPHSLPMTRGEPTIRRPCATRGRSPSASRQPGHARRRSFQPGSRDPRPAPP